jgi:hypothetical protein
MNFGTILADVYRRTGYKSSPPSDVVTRIKAFVNEVQQDLISETGLEFLINNNMTLVANTAGRPDWVLPSGTSRIKAVYDYTNRVTLDTMSLVDYRNIAPTTSSGDDEGIPSHWIDLGFSPLQTALPLDGSLLYADSTSAGDTQTVYVEGWDSNGPQVVSATMTGITAVALGSQAWLEVTKFYLSSAAVGQVLLTNTATDDIIFTTIQIGQTTIRYRRIALWPTPNAAMTYRVDLERDITDMVNSTDEPFLPVKFHRLLAIGARMKEYEKLNLLDRYAAAKGEYDEAVKKFKFWCYSQSVGEPNLRGFQGRRQSRFGAWYPI